MKEGRGLIEIEEEVMGKGKEWGKIVERMVMEEEEQIEIKMKRIGMKLEMMKMINYIVKVIVMKVNEERRKRRERRKIKKEKKEKQEK